MSPMHLCGCMDSMGNMTDEGIDYYEARAKGGFRRIFTNIYSFEGGERNTAVIEAFSDPVVFNSSTLKLSEKVHAYDSKLIVEAEPIFGSQES